MTTHDPRLKWLLVDVLDHGEWFVELWGFPEISTPPMKIGDTVTNVPLLGTRISPEPFEHVADALSPPARFIGVLENDAGNILSAARAIDAMTNGHRLRFLRAIVCKSVRAARQRSQRGAPMHPIIKAQNETVTPWLLVEARARRVSAQYPGTFLIALDRAVLADWLDANPEACLGDRLPEDVAEQSQQFLGFGAGTAKILACMPQDVCAYFSACAPFYPPHQAGPLSEALCLARSSVELGTRYLAHLVSLQPPPS